MSVHFEFVPAGERRRWDEALRELPHGYWHRWAACHAIGIGSGVPVYLCVASDANRVIAATPVAERAWQGERDLFTPAGFSGFAAAGPLPATFHSDWSNFAAGEGYVAGYFALHPRFGVATAHAGLESDNELFVLDLSGDPNELLQRFDRSVRRAVRASGKAGLQFITDRRSLTTFVIDNYAHCLSALGARERWTPATLTAMCADPDLLMVGVADDEGVCAVHTFGVSGRSAEFHLHLSVRDGRCHASALVWWGLQRLASDGIAWANMGGGIARDDSLAQSKRKFRPQAMPFLRAREVYRPAAYHELCARAGVDPRTSRFHPAYHAAPERTALPAP
ncbi:hypothetical protein BH11PSE14_BH11PSE14_09910 [soil metagenome]